ncbi:paired amphipathic helix protein Sin3-like 5 [Dendrobium catenatum]|uniref:paired amphipathic helix protein Sin3-like 5 n=1 Tax=Dendrobium catenatum TaxID=906689 RepID=UPI00109EFAE3|nr:paired amphipathic helix protein Sin3-like 5 [Dendrobium catenatum]
MASDTDTSAQKLTTSDALAYLKCVKDLFKDNKEKYNEFLEVMRGFKSQRINTYEVIMKVQELFKGHSDLILGFSKFLPNGYKIKVPEEKKPEEKKPADFHEAFNFVSKIKSRFENDQLTYRSFLNTLEMYRNHTKSSSEVRREVALLFKNHEDLFMEFLHFLPDASTSNAQLVSPGRRFARRDKFRTMKPPCMQKIQDRDMDREHEKKDANMTVESVKHRENKQINQGSPDVSKDVANHKVSLSPSIMDYKDLDLSNCPSCTPSYRLLPENCRAPVSSHRTELDKSVLNDVWVSVRSGTSSSPSRKSQYEESLFKCEDDRYELDMLVEFLNSTVEKVQNLVYGYNGFDVVDALKKMLVLSLILDRLKQKQEEWTSCCANFNKVCYQASKDDIVVYAEFSAPSSADYVNVSRWYNHIEALLRMRYILQHNLPFQLFSLPTCYETFAFTVHYINVSGEGQGMKVDGSTTISEKVPASQPIADTKYNLGRLNRSNLNQFWFTADGLGEGGTKGEGGGWPSGKSSILLDVKPWDDETDMQKLEAAVRSVKMEGLLWGVSKLVPVGYGIKKLQILLTIVDDLVYVDNLIEDHLTAKPANGHIQSSDIIAFNKICGGPAKVRASSRYPTKARASGGDPAEQQR